MTKFTSSELGRYREILFRYKCYHLGMYLDTALVSGVNENDLGERRILLIQKVPSRVEKILLGFMTDYAIERLLSGRYTIYEEDIDVANNFYSLNVGVASSTLNTAIVRYNVSDDGDMLDTALIKNGSYLKLLQSSTNREVVYNHILLGKASEFESFIKFIKKLYNPQPSSFTQYINDNIRYTTATTTHNSSFRIG